MVDIARKIQDLKAQIESKRKQLKEAENTLKNQIEAREKELAQAEQALKEAEWQEKLERVEKELKPLYQMEREKEDKINRDMNSLFNQAAKTVDSINTMYRDLGELREEIKGLEKQLIQSSRDHDSMMRKAIEFKKAEAAQNFDVTQQVKGASSLVRQVNIAQGVQGEVDEELLDEDFGYLPSYAQNIYDEVKRAGSKAVRAREDELIRLAGIPEPRIIKAREVLKKHLDKLEDNNLIQYEKEGDIYILKGSENRAF